MSAALTLRALALCSAGLLAACGPVSIENAERQCFERARLAVQPRGEIGVGAGNRGVRGHVELSISSDYIMGRDPSAVYEQCVFEKSGQPPRQPLYARSDWK